jgi:hypothetical protein
MTEALLSAFALICLMGLGHATIIGFFSVHSDNQQRKQAEEKASALLRSWLTAEQMKDWDARSEFDVLGSNSRTRYRIRRASAMNIDEVDSSGHVAAQWCFAPRGNLPLGDIMLAQKIALETMEENTLALANKRVPYQ